MSVVNSIVTSEKKIENQITEGRSVNIIYFLIDRIDQKTFVFIGNEHFKECYRLADLYRNILRGNYL